MELQHLEEQVASAEERALHLSLIGNHRFDAGELAEAEQNLNWLDAQAANHSCERAQALRMRIASVKAELEAVQYLRDYRGKGSLPPKAA